jgi:hypothetical protein
MYAREGSPRMHPGKLWCAVRLQAGLTICGARRLLEQMGYHLWWRGRVGCYIGDKVWGHLVYSRNQEQFHPSDPAVALVARILAGRGGKPVRMVSRSEFD